MNILFRTSGGRAIGKQLGLGHVYRCLNLAEYLKFHKLFFLVEDFGGIEEIIKKRGFNKIFKLKKNVCLKSDIAETIKTVHENSIDVVIVDKYNTKLEYIYKLKIHAKIVVISDLKKINYPSDLVVNGFIGYKNKIGVNRYGTRCFLGPNFQILNKNFTKKKISVKKHYSLLATFGGYDENKISEILLEKLAQYNSKIKTKIILGPSTRESKKIKILHKKLSDVKIVKGTKNMQKEILSAEFGLCSGGITSYEFAVSHIPFAIISQVKHQLITAKEWENKGIALNLGLVNNLTGKKIGIFLKTISERKLQYAKKNLIFDGKGAQRITNEILRLS